MLKLKKDVQLKLVGPKYDDYAAIHGFAYLSQIRYFPFRRYFLESYVYPSPSQGWNCDRINFHKVGCYSSDDNYDEARTIYNAMIDKHPGAIIKCQSPDDVIKAVNYAREYTIEVSIRSGGHNGPGLASCDDGLVIDLSEMKAVRVDPEAKTVRAEAGCTWGDGDLYGMFGLDEHVRPGLSKLRAKITIGGNVDEETLQEIAGLGLKFSLGQDTVVKGITVNPEIMVV